MRRLALSIIAVLIFAALSTSAQQVAEVTLVSSGVIIAESDGLPEIIDTYSLVQAADGSYKLISSFVDDFDEVNAQDLTLDAEFRPLSYARYLSSPADEEIIVRAEFVENRAIVSLKNNDGFQQQTFTTDTEFMILDGAALDQLLVMLERFYVSGQDVLEFDALIVGALQHIPSTLSHFGELDVRVRNTGEIFTVQEYAWDSADGGRVLRILVLDGEFVGAIQLNDQGTEDVAYRADLYPGGLEILR